MTQIEFIDKLNACLSGKVPAGTVQENVAYYRQYFMEEMRQGRSEEAVCASLGSPQLIAKGILEAERFQAETEGNSEYTQKVHEEKNYRSTGSCFTKNERSLRLPGWLIGVIMVLIFFAVISVVLSVFSALAPLILPLCIIWFVVQLFKNIF
jgi:uncharacterized membrane protein